MKKMISFLFCMIFFVNGAPAQPGSAIDEIKEDLKKCKISLHTSLVKDVVDCLKKENIGNIDFQERAKAGLAMVMCAGNNLKNIPKCINRLSEYVVKLENASYVQLEICSPLGDWEMKNFQDLIDLDEDEPIFWCRKPFENNSNKETRTLTKNEFLQHVLNKIDFILVGNDLFFYSIKELELYFEYINLLYEEKV